MTHRDDDGRTDQRATYEAPHLVLLGSLSDMTLGPGGNNEDGVNGNLLSDVLP